MIKNKTLCMVSALGMAFFVSMIVVACTAKAESKKVSDSVLRFHIVAASDSAEDQALKMKVRDGIADLTGRLFSDVTTKEQAIKVAEKNRTVIAEQAIRILRQNGSDDLVNVQIKNLYFPTKQYENISFPAGNYDAIHISIGEGKGQNFWCVMFPALCVPGVSRSNEKLLSDVMGKKEVDLVMHPFTLKFKFAEWWGKLSNKFAK